MTKKNLLKTLVLVSTLACAGPALAALPDEPGDIKTGDDLAAACTPLAKGDRSDEGETAGRACSGFLGAMMQKVVESTAAGAPTTFNRIGPKQEHNLCFFLPPKLSFVDFSKLILAYRPAHPELDQRPAYETAAWTLSVNFPCPDAAVAP
tara:strand:- start:6531 stop:6980 length:450 start_codon:yes stop_codon:yes gene_type:complete